MVPYKTIKCSYENCTQSGFVYDELILKHVFILVIVQSNRLEELTTDVTCFNCRYVNIVIIVPLMFCVDIYSSHKDVVYISIHNKILMTVGAKINWQNDEDDLKTGLHQSVEAVSVTLYQTSK